MQESIKQNIKDLGMKEVGKYYCAICDDEVFTCAYIEEIVIEYSQKNKINIEVDVFYQGEELSDILRKRSYDIIFLDINLITSSGISIGKLIRYELNNEVTQIIYISSGEQYAMQLFQTRPTDFILKPFSKEQIIQVYKQAIKIIERGSKTIEFQVGRDHYKVLCNQIIYFQSNKRKIEIIFEDQRIEFYGKLDELYEQLPSTDFIGIHKSYLINCNYVYCYSYESVTMKNGDILPISQTRRKVVREKILQRKRGRK